VTSSTRAASPSSPAPASVIVACATRSGRAGKAAVRSSGFGFGANSLACSNGRGATSSRATTTRTPSLVIGHSLRAKSFVSRMHPCEAG
jgi:hypothetical protein